MAVVEGFWVAGLEGSEARMNACLTLIGTAAEITALNAATYKRCFAYATNTYQFYYSNGSTWVVMGIGVHTHQSDGQGGHLVDGVDVSVLKSQADANTTAMNAVEYTTPTRAISTIYQNTTGKMLFVTVTVILHNDYTGAMASAHCDAASTPGTMVAYAAKNGVVGAEIEMETNLVFIVPNNHYYRVLQDTGVVTIRYWREWKLH